MAETAAYGFFHAALSKCFWGVAGLFLAEKFVGKMANIVCLLFFCIFNSFFTGW